MDWWVIRQLRQQVITDLQGFIPTDHFSLRKKVTIDELTGEHWSREMNWGLKAVEIGKKLFYDPPLQFSARQVSASDLLLNLGLLAGGEAAHGMAGRRVQAERDGTAPASNSIDVATQLENEQLPVLRKNVTDALTQYLRHLSALESSPFSHLIQHEKMSGEKSLDQEGCAEVRAVFEHRFGSAISDASSDFANRLDAWQRDEGLRSGQIGGAGFVARLSKLFEAEITTRSKLISKCFGHPQKPASGIEQEQILFIATNALEMQCEGLAEAYRRRLDALGITSEPPDWSRTIALERASISNRLRSYYSAKKGDFVGSNDDANKAPTFNFYGSVGAVQTGSNSVANVTQHISGEAKLLTEALCQLRHAAMTSEEVDKDARGLIASGVAKIETELALPSPNKSRLVESFAGISAAMKGIASLRPAYEVARDSFAALMLFFGS